jgi:hypothetical protein
MRKRFRFALAGAFAAALILSWGMTSLLTVESGAPTVLKNVAMQTTQIIRRRDGLGSTQRVDPFGAFPTWWPRFLPQSPAFFLPALAIAFRFTCYYYRGAYYKAFAVTPPSCGVRGLPLRYRGETAMLLFQNLHRYTLYGALILLVCLWWEGVSAFFREGRFGIGVGTVVMLANALLLTGYTFGCHSWRHLIGGRLDCFTCDGAVSPRYQLWKGSSWLNDRHMAFAWVSLVWVAFTDLYIYLVSTGTIRDLSTW